MTSIQNRYLVLIVMSLALFVMSLSITSLTPFIPLIITHYTITNAEAGLLISAFFLTYALVQVPIGAFSDKVDIRKILVLSSVTMLVGALIFHISPNFHIAVLGRAIIGLGAGSVYIPGIKLISGVFPSSQRGLAIGIYGGIGQGAMFLSISTLIPLMNFFQSDWLVMHTLLVLPSLLIIILVILFIRSPDRLHSSNQTILRNIVSVSKNRRGLTLWAYVAVVGGSNWAIMYWAPTIIMAHNFPSDVSSFIGSMIPLSATVGNVLGGVIADKVSNKRLVLILSVPLQFLAFSLFLLSLTSRNEIFLIATLLAVGLFPYLLTLIYSWIFDIYQTGTGGTSLGIVNGMVFVGAVVYPFLMGLTLDLTQSYPIMISVLISSQILTLVSAFLSPRSVKLRRNHTNGSSDI